MAVRRAVRQAIFLRGEWIEQAGLIDEMPLKIRVMPDCIVIATQNTRELWCCVEGLSVVPINRKMVAKWPGEFPGATNDTGDVPVFKRDNGHFG